MNHRAMGANTPGTVPELALAHVCWVGRRALALTVLGSMSHLASGTSARRGGGPRAGSRRYVGWLPAQRERIRWAGRFN